MVSIFFKLSEEEWPVEKINFGRNLLGNLLTNIEKSIVSTVTKSENRHCSIDKLLNSRHPD